MAFTLFNISIFTNLERACMLGEEESLRSELEEISDINATGNLGYTPLQLACTLRNEKTIDTILDYKPDMNVKSSCGNAALNMFVQLFPPNARLLKKFLEAGADPNIADPRGRTPLHLAVHRGNSEIFHEYFRILFQYKADPQPRARYGYTPLHQAILCGNLGAVKILLQNGALTNNENFQNETERDLAILHRNDFPEVMQEITDHTIMRNFIRKGTNALTAKDILSDIEKYPMVKKCYSELVKSNNTTLGESSVTYYHIFSLPPYALAKKLRGMPESVTEIDEKLFPIFGRHMAQNFASGSERCIALNIGHEFVRKLCPVIPELCIDIILSYLSNTDLMKLRLVLENV